jgi:hypothetical protein
MESMPMELLTALEILASEGTLGRKPVGMEG